MIGILFRGVALYLIACVAVWFFGAKRNALFPFMICLGAAMDEFGLSGGVFSVEKMLQLAVSSLALSVIYIRALQGEAKYARIACRIIEIMGVFYLGGIVSFFLAWGDIAADSAYTAGSFFVIGYLVMLFGASAQKKKEEKHKRERQRSHSQYERGSWQGTNHEWTGYSYFNGCSDEQTAKNIYRSWCKKLHPDNPGGNAAKFREMNEEYLKWRRQYA